MAAFFDPMDWDDEESDLSSSMGTDTLIANEIEPPGFDSTPKLPIRTVNGLRYLEVDQTANRRNGSKILKIWQYGTELRSLDTSGMEKYWICSLCPSRKVIFKILSSGNNSNITTAGRHLRGIHKISTKDPKEEEEEKEEGLASLSILSPVPTVAGMMVAAPAKAIKGFRALVTRINADNFRWALLKWIISMHVILVMIKSESFRELIYTIAPSLDAFMVTSAVIIRRWIMKLF
jgi:hypothetical protein